MKIFIINHPAHEPRYGHVRIGQSMVVPWNTGPSHNRKYIERGGLIYNGSTIFPSKLYFWGEYEPMSDATIISSTSVPMAIHNVLHPVGAGNSIPQSPSGCCQNTDPYVFGDEFYYFCCKRRHKCQYQKGDIILFGTVLKQNNNSFGFFLDTLFVVKDVRSVNNFNPIDNYWKCTLDPVLYQCGLPYNDVIVGEMYSSNQIEYSFVPCRKEPTPKTTPTKPVIDLTKYRLPNITSWLYYPKPIQLSHSPFNSLVQDISAQGFEQAIYIDRI